MKRPINERPLTATLQKSYYGKAVVITNGDEIALRSYQTIVASYNTATGEFKRLWSGWSTTTANALLTAEECERTIEAIQTARPSVVAWYD